ncbi:MAG TPA: mucoidy inhibitor MuiA family protein [Geothrix sp.]|nr:mucoidy inhibitor MuiA family protein [Geothrix sp.]
MRSLTLLSLTFGLTASLTAQPSAGLLGPSLLPIEAPIRRVRLHPDECWVTRVGRTNLPQKGTYQLLLSGLPEGLQLEDVRVSAKGSAGSRLGDVTVGSEPRKIAETPEYQSLKQQQLGLRDRIDALESEGEALRQEISFLKGLQAVHDQELSSRLTVGVPSSASVVELGKGIQERMAQALTRERQIQRELAVRKEEMKGIEAELLRKAAERQVSPAKAKVEIVCAKAGDVEIDFTYRTRTGHWEPSYEARLSADGRSLELVLFAAIRHGGKEHWNGVEVEVTNARSSRNVTLEKLGGPQWVRFTEQFPGTIRGSATATACVEVVASSSGFGSNGETPVQPSVLADLAPARVARLEDARGLATTWSLEGHKDIPADGDVHRFRVTSTEVHPDLSLLAIPRQDPTVYRIARFAIPKELPLFPGSTMVHFAGSQRVGQSSLDLPAPGHPVQLGFGPFTGVRVALRRLDNRKETVGTFSKETQWIIKDRFDITNDLSEAVAIEVQDAQLKADQDRIKITLLPDSTPCQDEPLPGVRQWHLDLGGGATRSVNLTTQIRVPMGGWVQGLGAMDLPQ